MKPRLWLLAPLLFLTSCTEDSTRAIAIHAEQQASRSLFISIAIPVLAILVALIVTTRGNDKE